MLQGMAPTVAWPCSYGCRAMLLRLQGHAPTVAGDSFIPYPGCALAGHTACAIDSSSLIIFGGNLETTAGFEQVRP